MQLAAFRGGILTPQPLWLCEEAWLAESGFMLMTHSYGLGDPAEIVGRGADHHLAERLGRELARIHKVKVPAGRAPKEDLVAEIVARYRSYLDKRPESHPVMEWGLRWLEVNAPPVMQRLGHGDFRTGNFLVNEEGLTAILDWEFADWADPHADIAWFCAKCWRRDAIDREAGGVAPRHPFYCGYEDETGTKCIDRDVVAYWELMAHVRWAIIALQQVDRFLSGTSKRLEHALLGRRIAELEFEILRMTGANA